MYLDSGEDDQHQDQPIPEHFESPFVVDHVLGLFEQIASELLHSFGNRASSSTATLAASASL